jgi:hypothetical protein
MILVLTRPKVQPYHNNSILEAQYHELLAATSCASLECLRSIDETALNMGAQAATVSGYQTKPMLYSYGDYYFGPSVDGEYASLLLPNFETFYLHTDRFVTYRPMSSSKAILPRSLFL